MNFLLYEENFVFFFISMGASPSPPPPKLASVVRICCLGQLTKGPVGSSVTVVLFCYCTKDKGNKYSILSSFLALQCQTCIKKIVNPSMSILHNNLKIKPLQYNSYNTRVPSNLLISSGGINFVTPTANFHFQLLSLLHKISKNFENKLSF